MTEEHIGTFVMDWHMALVKLQEHGLSVIEEIAEHPRYNEKLAAMRAHLRTLELLAEEVKLLAEMRRLHPGSVIGRINVAPKQEG